MMVFLIYTFRHYRRRLKSLESLSDGDAKTSCLCCQINKVQSTKRDLIQDTDRRWNIYMTSRRHLGKQKNKDILVRFIKVTEVNLVRFSLVLKNFYFCYKDVLRLFTFYGGHSIHHYYWTIKLEPTVNVKYYIKGTRLSCHYFTRLEMYNDKLKRESQVTFLSLLDLYGPRKTERDGFLTSRLIGDIRGEFFVNRTKRGRQQLHAGVIS